MPLRAIARLIQTMLYAKRFFPYYVYNILGGIEEDGMSSFHLGVTVSAHSVYPRSPKPRPTFSFSIHCQSDLNRSSIPNLPSPTLLSIFLRHASSHLYLSYPCSPCRPPMCLVSVWHLILSSFDFIPAVFPMFTDLFPSFSTDLSNVHPGSRYGNEMTI
jgi:hypothetical protein